MYRLLKNTVVCLCLLLSSFYTMGEGTRELMKYEQHNGRIVLDSTFGGFALFNANHSDRLHIRINKPGEKIYFGLGNSIQSFIDGQEVVNDVYYRIVSPSGAPVTNITLQPTSGNGYIDSYEKAVAGPIQFDPAGYDPLVITANGIGDYYIEFHFSDLTFGGRREFDFFDITVVSEDNVPIPGRVWSKSWMITVSEKGGDPWDNPFHGKMFILSDDHIVTSVDFNGMQPFVFTMFANGTGVKNTGNPIEDRKSVPDKLSYPQYKVFLNDPDPGAFPSGTFGDFAAPTTLTGDGPYCINVTTTKPGTVQILIDLNGQPGYQVNSSDILIAKNVGAGYNCVSWDGRDGNGNMVDKCSQSIRIISTYAGGLTHMPIYDVETNLNGFIVELVRPSTASRLALYWDDSKLKNYTIPPSAGCDGSLGCHKFPYFYGDTSTINTWWYAVSANIDTLLIQANGVQLDDVVVQNQSCSNKVDGSIEVFGSGGDGPITYALNGGAFQSKSYFENLPEGTYRVRIKDQKNCIQEREVVIELNTTILADFDYDTDGAYNDILFEFLGEGANVYSWNFGDGDTDNSAEPFHHYNYDTTYLVKLLVESGPPDFCRDSVTKLVEIYPSLQIYAPTAFSPNGDNLNDLFKVYGIAVHAYELYIFASDGTQIFHSNNLESMWDGTFRGERLDHGVFAYVIRAKDRKGITHETKGTVTLMR